MKSASICERIAEPLLRIHRNTTPVWAVVVAAIVGIGVIIYGLNVGNRDVAWVGALVAITSWYGFLLSGCERLLAAKDAELNAAGIKPAGNHGERKQERRKRKDRKRN